MEIRDLLNKKGKEVYHVSPDTTVYEAISKMSEYDVGALLVLEDDKLCGLISERDYRNKVILKGRTSKDTPVGDIMSTKLITITPKDSVENCMHLMTDKRVRHLPVMDDDQVVGVISIGDIVKSIIDKQKEEIEDLKGYISGNYPG